MSRPTTDRGRASKVAHAQVPRRLSAQTPQPAPTVAADPLPSITLPAGFDQVLRNYERAWRTNDIPALVSLFTEDGFVLQPGRPPARGRSALTTSIAVRPAECCNFAH